MQAKAAAEANLASNVVNGDNNGDSGRGLIAAAIHRVSNARQRILETSIDIDSRLSQLVGALPEDPGGIAEAPEPLGSVGGLHYCIGQLESTIDELNRVAGRLRDL